MLRQVATADEEATPETVEVTSTGTERHHRAAAADTARKAGEATALRSTEGVMALRHVDMGAEGTVGRRHHPTTRGTRLSMTAGTTGGLRLLVLTIQGRMAQGSNHPVRHLRQVTETPRGVTRRTRHQTIFRGQNPLRHSRELTMALAASRRWKWTPRPGDRRSQVADMDSMGSETATLTWLACLLCSKLGPLPAHIARTSKP